MSKTPEGLFSELYENSNQTDGAGSVIDDEQSAQWESGFFCYRDTTSNNQPYANRTSLCDSPDFDWEDPPTTCNGTHWGPYTFDRPLNQELEASVLSSMGYELETTGFAKTIPNRDGTLASHMYATLYHSKFIDLQVSFPPFFFRPFSPPFVPSFYFFFLSSSLIIFLSLSL